MDVGKSGERAVVCEDLDGGIEESVLECVVESRPGQAADDRVDGTGFVTVGFQDVGCVCDRVVDDGRVGVSPPQRLQHPLVSFDRQKIGIRRQHPLDFGGEGPGAGTVFDDEFGSVNAEFGDDLPSEGRRAGGDGTDGFGISGELDEELSEVSHHVGEWETERERDV